MYDSGLKRVLDVALSSVALVILSPVLLLVAVCIWGEDRGPIIFRQRRVGRHGAPFTMFKFRSMRTGTAELPSAAARATVITRTGRFIRRTNLDELPQLVNVLLGHMSIVGPRPPLCAQQELCELRTRNGAIHCRPGLTGLAQVNAYDGMPDSLKADWDGKYAGSVSLSMDAGVVLRTVVYLLKPPPVY